MFDRIHLGIIADLVKQYHSQLSDDMKRWLKEERGSGRSYFDCV